MVHNIGKTLNGQICNVGNFGKLKNEKKKKTSNSKTTLEYDLKWWCQKL